ncbi:hypothetical protein F4780DRAFT_673414 [Xylariomycetidae sp. FL0641]|nr:hypothetical protein F4780DRAFT_673414 [Xylariomycetidae sp. FL0641]
MTSLTRRMPMIFFCLLVVCQRLLRMWEAGRYLTIPFSYGPKLVKRSMEIIFVDSEYLKMWMYPTRFCYEIMNRGVGEEEDFTSSARTGRLAECWIASWWSVTPVPKVTYGTLYSVPMLIEIDMEVSTCRCQRHLTRRHESSDAVPTILLTI